MKGNEEDGRVGFNDIKNISQKFAQNEARGYQKRDDHTIVRNKENFCSRTKQTRLLKRRGTEKGLGNHASMNHGQDTMVKVTA